MMRFVLLGAGRIGRVHATNIANHKNAEILSVYDVNPKSAEAVAEEQGATVCSSASEAVADRRVDGVLICSSTDTHVDLIELAAKHRKPIFCEKPIDLDLSRVDRCLAQVSDAGVPLFIGFNRRFDPSFRALKQALVDGKIGALEILKITSRDPSPPPAEYVAVSGGIFRDMMIHDLDMARYLLPEEPCEIFATGSCLVDEAIGKAGDIDTAMVVMKTKGGALCHIDNSRRAVYGYDQRIEAFGAKGLLQADNPLPTTVRHLTEEKNSLDLPPHFFIERYVEAYQKELEHFIQVVAEATHPSVDGRDGRAALVLADAAARSLAENRPVRL